MKVTEEYIKSFLDGTHTRVDHNGTVVTYTVDSNGVSKPNTDRSKTYAAWTPDDEKILLSMVDNGHNVNDIAWVLNRSIEATISKMRVMKTKRGSLIRNIEIK